MVLLGLRLYPTDALLGYRVDFHERNVGRERTRRLLPALEAVLPLPLRTELGLGGAGSAPAEARRKLGTRTELLERFPEVREVLVDATEQPVPRPQDPGRQTTHYSGKKKRHSTKTQGTTTDQLVLHASRAVLGSVHDLTLLRFSGVLHQLPPGVRVRLDRGYEGVETEFPDVPIEKPCKSRRNHRLTAFGRAYNRMQSHLRIVVEHVLAALEKFHILAGVYRGRPQHYDACFGVVAGLHNFRTLGRLTW